MTLLQVTKEMTEFFPAVLKFGITGLSAIVFLLAYFLLSTQNRKDKPNSNMLKTIKSFMWIALTFSILSAISSFTEGYFIKKAINSDSDKNIRTEVLTDLATEKVYSTYDEIERRHSVEHGMVGKGGGGGVDDPYDTTRMLRQAMNENEFEYRAIQQAIFRNMYNLGADRTILDSVLSRLSHRINFTDETISKSRNNFSEILSERFKWLNNYAIPSSQKQLDEWVQNNQVVQESPNTEIVLPKYVWIFDHYPSDNQPSIDVGYSELSEMRSELEIIKKQLK